MTIMPSGSEPKPGPFARAVSDEIRLAIARHRVSGTRLAKMIGRSQSYVSKRFNHGAAFTANDVELSCKVLGEDLLTLVTSAVKAARQGNGGSSASRVVSNAKSSPSLGIQ